jgi:hypothetical protein
VSDRFNIKQGNRLPTLRVQCLDGDGVGVDLATATAQTFSMRHSDTGVAKLTGGACTVVGTTDGIVDYAWAAIDTDTAGDYEGEVTVTFPAGKASTFPGQGRIGVHIEERVAST